MKKLFLLLIISTLSINIFAQLKLENVYKPEKIYVNPLGFFQISKQLINDSVYNYYITFKDCQYTSITVYKEISFLSKEDIIDFFNLIKSVINTKEDKIVSFNEQTILIKYTSKIAKMYVGDAFCWWNIKWTNKCIEALELIKP